MQCGYLGHYLLLPQKHVTPTFMNSNYSSQNPTAENIKMPVYERLELIFHLFLFGIPI